MAVYNSENFLQEAVSSILLQTYRDFELIVVDDASSDSSPSILRRFRDPRMQIITHRANTGVALSRNDALQVARGEFVAIMDSDDVCSPARLERQVAFLDSNSLVGLVGCGVFDNIDASGQVLYTSYLPQDNETIQQSLLERWCFLHPSIMFKRALQERVGGYRKAFEPAEDHDFILRMLEHCQAHNLPERLVSYRLNPKGLSVVAHRYIDELGNTAMRLARRRRSGQAENLDGEIDRLLEQKRHGQPRRGLSGALQSWRNSFYAAVRYYGFGCRELCADHPANARRCFVQSLRTNPLFVKSWIGAALSFTPFFARRVKFLFRSSMEQAGRLSLRKTGVASDERPALR